MAPTAALTPPREINTTDAMRYTLGDMQSYAARMNMASVVPWDNSTACFRQVRHHVLPDGRFRYLSDVLLQRSTLGAKNLTVNASATTSQCEWFNLTTRATAACTYLGTGSHNYTAPGTGPYLLFVTETSNFRNSNWRYSCPQVSNSSRSRGTILRPGACSHPGEAKPVVRFYSQLKVDIL